MSVKSLSSSSLTNNVFYRSLLVGNDPFIPFTAADDLLAEVTLTSSASSVTFSGLGAYSDYKHLQIRMVSRSTSTSGNNVGFRMNGDTGSNYASHRLYGNGSGVFPSSASSIDKALYYLQPISSDDTGNFGSGIIDLLDFSSTSKTATLRWMYGFQTTNSHVGLCSGLWNNTAAVTSLEIAPFSDNFAIGSRFSLVGIR